MKIYALLSFLLIAAATLSAQQAAPKLMHYQGKLTNPTGGALADGQYTLRFELFDAATAGQRIWGENRTNVPLLGGLFSVVLGAAGSEPVSPSAVNDLGFAFGGADRYLQTTVVSGPGVTAPQTLLPRQQLASVPFALQSQKAAQADQAANSALLNGQPPATFMPPGGVIAYGGTTEPAGWLICDGRAVSRETYAGLFAAIGTAHGTGDGGSTFNLPDYRWTFLRGYGPNISVTGTGTASGNQAIFPNHGFNRSGVKVRVNGGTLAGLSTGIDYWVIVVDANTLAFASSKANATAATPTRIVLSGNNTAAIVQWEDPDVLARERNAIGANLGSNIGTFQFDIFKSHSHNYDRARFSHDEDENGNTFRSLKEDTSTSTTATGGNETRPQNVSVNYIIKY